MHRTRVKICGITRPEDAAVAAAAGADAIGMVFYPPADRCVTPAVAREIVENIGPFVSTIGLFVDAAPADIVTRALELGLSMIQLHGKETPKSVAQLRPLPVIKALRLEKANAKAVLDEWRSAIKKLNLSHLVGFVLEAPTPEGQVPGGNGVSNDWDFIASLQAEAAFNELPPWIAAGGLTPENAGEVVRRLRPWAVDVSSGVEEKRGEKSAQKVEAFIQAVQRADIASATQARPDGT